jgi:hypothetical protein
MFDHDDVPQYRGPTLCTTIKVTAPKTKSKALYVCGTPRANATRPARPRTSAPRRAPAASTFHQISKTLHKKRKGLTGQAGKEHRRASTTQSQLARDTARDSPNVMVCSCDSGAHACCDERARPSCQYWDCEGQEAGQEEQVVLYVVWCGSRGVRVLRARGRGGASPGGGAGTCKNGLARVAEDVVPR